MVSIKINRKKLHKFITEFIPVIFIAIISILILRVSSVSIGNNAAKYLSQANMMMQGQDREMLFPEFETTRGSVYPMILVIAFKSLGKSVLSASLATRLFFSLSIVMIYLLGRVFYGKTVGILASLLVMSSSGINSVAQAIDTDIVLSFFILLFVLLFYQSLNRLSRYWAVFAGLSLGIALMTKESAVFCFGLPFIMIIIAPRDKRIAYLKLGLWSVGATIVTLLPWMIKTIAVYGSLRPMLGVANPEILQASVKTAGYASSFSYWAYLFTSGLKKTLLKFYDGYFREVTPFSPFMLAGLIILFIRSLFLKRNRDLILIISAFCFLPLILRVADSQVRLGHTTIVFMLFYIILAVSSVFAVSFSIDHIYKFIYKVSKLDKPSFALNYSQKYVCGLLVLAIGFFYISSQLFSGENPTWEKWRKRTSALAIFSKEPFKVDGRFLTEQQDAAEWLKKHTFDNTKIIADGYSQEALEFFGAADYKIPVFHVANEISILTGSLDKKEDSVRPIFFITYANIESGAQSHRVIFTIFEEEILSGLRKESPDYLVLSGRGLFFKAYFDKAGWVHLRFKNDFVHIYEIHMEGIEPVPIEHIGVNDTINKHLIWLEDNYPEEYLLLKEKLKILGLTVDELKNSPLRFPEGQVY